MSSLEEPIRYRFSSLQGLRSLSLANVDFYDSGLVDVCSLPRLESLDLSNTSVTNLSPLLGLKERLRSLTLHQLKRLEMSTAQLLGVIRQLDVLQVSEDEALCATVNCPLDICIYEMLLATCPALLMHYNLCTVLDTHPNNQPVTKFTSAITETNFTLLLCDDVF